MTPPCLKRILFCFVLLPISLFSQTEEQDLLKSIEEFKANTNYEKLGTAEYQLSKLYYNDYEDSLSELHIKQAIDAFQKVNNPRGLAESYNQYAILVSDHGDLNFSAELTLKAIHLAKKIPNDTLICFFKNNLGLVYKDLGEYDSAITYLYEALQLKEKIGLSKKSISSSLVNIGLVWDILEKYDDAKKYYKQSLLLKKEIGDLLGAARVYNNLATVAKNEENYSMALSYLDSCYSIAKVENDENLLYQYHTNKGIIYKRLDQLDLVVKHYDSAIVHANNLGYFTELSDLYQNLGFLHLDQKNYQEAIKCFNESLTLANETHSSVLYYEITAGLAEAHAANGDFQQAYHFFKISDAFEDSLFQLEDQKLINEIKTQYEVEKKEKEIALKNYSLSKSESENKSKTITIMILIGIFLLVLCIGIFSWFMYRNTQKRKQARLQANLDKYSREIELLKANVHSYINDRPSKLELSVTKEDINQYLIDPLSDREKEVLQKVSLGKTNKEIADLVFISENTVKFHLKNIYVKLDVKNRTEALTKADVLKILD